MPKRPESNPDSRPVVPATATDSEEAELATRIEHWLNLADSILKGE